MIERWKVYCRNCANQVSDQAVMCVRCGTPPLRGNQFCQSCGASTQANAVVCIKCGVSLRAGSGEKSKMAAGLLGVFLGPLGIHRFYLGYTSIGIAQIVVTVVTLGVGGLWGFIEGILILTGTINTDAKGNPLAD